MDNLQQPSVLAMPFANNGDKNVIPSAPTGTNKASLSEGFPQITSESIAEGGIPPERADFNALGNIATMFYYFMQCGGAYTFRADVSLSIGGYPKGALLWYIPATGIPNLLTSTINNNTRNFNTDPSVIGEAGSGKPWEIVTVSPTNFMDLISNQTARGTKTFADPLYVDDNIHITNTQNTYRHIYTDNSVITKGTVPSATTGTELVLRDSSDSNVGSVAVWYSSGGNIVAGIRAYKPTAGSTDNVSIQIHYDANGTTYGTCPTPESLDNSDKIVTTKLIHNSTEEVICITNMTMNANGSYVKKYSNGWLEQGGIASSVPANGSSTITLPESFANSNYSVSLTYRTTSGITGGGGDLSYNPSTGSFVLFNGQDNTLDVCWKAVGIGA